MKSPVAVLLGAEAQSLVNFRRDLIAVLARTHEVHVVARAASPDDEQIIAQLGATFHTVPMARAGMNPFRDLLTVVGLYRLFRHLRPQCLLSYTPKPVLYGTFAAWLARVPVRAGMITGLGFAFVEGQELRRKIARAVVGLLYRFILPRATSLIFQNPDDLALFRTLGLLQARSPAHVVNGSGVDCNGFSPVPLPEKPSFLMIARLLKDKGTHEYARASKLVRVAVPSARTALIGWVDESPNSISPGELEAWIADGMAFGGRLKDVRPAIAEASVVVLPSYREGTPRSVLEGMAMGRAIITTDVPGCRETVQHGVNGLLVPARDAEALARAMEELAADPGRVAIMGGQSRRIALEKYEAREVALDTLRKAGILRET